MILRRITEHVKAQNWTAVALDFVIVVVGVFMGIQVSNWNDARADGKVAARHLTEIAEDLQSHLQFNDALVGSATARIAAVDYIYEEAFNRKLPKTLILATEVWHAPPMEPFPEEKRDYLMGAINLVRITVGSRKGYESLINSGHLGLIKNRQLARDIQLYYGEYDDLLDTNGVFRTFRNDGVRDQYQYGVSVFDERPADEIIVLTRENPHLAAYLRSQREWAILHANLLEDLRVKTEVLLEAINAELGRR